MKGGCNMNKNLRRLIELSLLLSFGIILGYIESFIPLPIPVPGIKLGLANIIGLLILYFYSLKEYLCITLLRILIVNLLRGSLISLLISLGGFVFSSVIISLLYLINKFSIYGISILSAFFHSIGQIVVVILIYNLPQLFYYLPFILISSIISSIIISVVSVIIISRTKFFIIGGAGYEKANN